MKANVPQFGSNTASCEITGGGGTPAPFQCTHNISPVSGSSSYHPVATFMVTDGQSQNRWIWPESKGITQQEVAARLLDLCTANAQLCRFDHTGSPTRGSDTQDLHPVGYTVVNCTSRDISQNFNWTDETSGSTTFGLDVKVGGQIAKVVQAELTGKFSQTWAWRASHGGSITTTTASGEAVTQYRTPIVDQITGNFVFTVGNQTWTLGNVRVTSPIPGEAGMGKILAVRKERSTQEIHLCEGNPGRDAVMVPVSESPSWIPSAGAYKMRAQMSTGEDQVVDVPAATEKSGEQLQIYPANGTSAQNWRFRKTPVKDYYQIVSDNSPNMNLCLDAETGGTKPRVLQYDCKYTDDPTLQNQLWTRKYVPNQGYVLVTKGGEYLSWQQEGDKKLLYAAHDENAPNTKWVIQQ
ncbi:RICIN domain-containing protein [Streptomyces sp. NPDC058249]|uniref:RICIN domain-containing protein n=1 Tax=Streptomyces sp. NPDC058249 TaxID=3346403 RepID=UPI0036E078D6